MSDTLIDIPLGQQNSDTVNNRFQISLTGQFYYRPVIWMRLAWSPGESVIASG
ncbi:hypothetical protein [Amphritea pacifica]|uniref:Uncharacterized protein n=1 Tax=Amphritea pacifica TaxID=2811233 RepID=A0ABS2W7C9_9GAMM|nr:hypothetical protein [Amphritea pacifica]MBN0987593.1 hypothetical protein [Amphritea pacifica]MBN1007438.1 hypothetical protein [Amphritea pacifica]